jgi:hypothetical protein
VQRKWLQGHPTLSLPRYRNASWVHFDISLSKKSLALRAGARLTDMYGPLEFQARRMIASGDPALVERGNVTIGRIAMRRDP